PLRHRKEDIPLLVEHFLEGGRAKGLPAVQISDELLQVFQSYDWPGNVRELKHCIDRLSAMQSEGALLTQDLPSAFQYVQATKSLEKWSGAVEERTEDLPAMPAFQISPRSPVISLPESERHAIARALDATGGERGKTARLLGIGRTTLYRKMKQ